MTEANETAAYELVGKLTRKQAEQVAELLAGSSVLWDRDHTFPCDGVEIRPAAVSVRRKFADLPQGTRFRYIGYSDVYVKLESHDCGLVARWNGPNADAVMQEIFSFADSPGEARTKEVEVVEHD